MQYKMIISNFLNDKLKSAKTDVQFIYTNWENIKQGSEPVQMISYIVVQGSYSLYNRT